MYNVLAPAIVAMKTLAAFLLCLFLSALPAHAKQQEKLYIASVFPVWLILKEVTRDIPGVRVELLLPASTGCPHEYVITPQVRRTLARADVFVQNGLGLESFLGEGARLKNVLKPGASVVDCSLGVEGVLEEEHGVNPHIFASPFMATKMALSMAAQLAAINPDYAALYRENGERTAVRLKNLATESWKRGSRLNARCVLVQHGIFSYLARDIGLSVEGLIQQQEGQEPSAREFMDLVRLIQKKKVAAVITEPQYPARAGQTLAAETGIPCFSLNPVAHGSEDATLDFYERAMYENLDRLEKNLGSR